MYPLPLVSAVAHGEVALWAVTPFALLLGMIAAMPFINKHFWEHHYAKVSVALGIVGIAIYYSSTGNWHRVMHTGLEYISFIALIGSLFVVAGGIHISVKGEATPLVNVLFLAIGAVLANIIGTTGASMLLIRPWIRMNKYRITAFHIVFFIFIVSNVGGCLTPIGDPPLFLGYLKSVPFWWTLQHLWQPWLMAVGCVLAVFAVVDTLNFRKAPKEIRDLETAEEQWKFDGLHNLGFLAAILGGVFLPTPWREVVMVGCAAGSFFTTGKQTHEANDFNFGPIREVAFLFVGIFATMIPALDWLEHHASDLGLDSPLKFYWITGVLSSVLDNAPTYLTFLATSVSQQVSVLDGHKLSVDSLADMAEYLKLAPHYLVAISLGAVFFGASTYIGNGPNFMVKAIAEQSKVKTPDFFSYILFYSAPVLLPIFAFVGWLFLR